jgi:transcriptional regulator with XRE-family HTH domain
MGHVHALERRAVARIASVRRAKQMTQQQLAEITGIRRAALSEIEHGQRYLRLGEALALCAALGVELGAVVADEPLVLRTQIVQQID